MSCAQREGREPKRDEQQRRGGRVQHRYTHSNQKIMETTRSVDLIRCCLRKYICGGCHVLHQNQRQAKKREGTNRLCSVFA